MLHVGAYLLMLREDGPEDIIKEEQLLLETCLNLFSLLLQDVAAPHADDLPSLELLEELLL